MIEWVSPTKMSNTKGNHSKQHGGRGRGKAPNLPPPSISNDSQASESESEDEEEEEWTCYQCEGKYSEQRDTHWFECAACQATLCSQCKSTPKKEWQVVNDNKNIHWFCDPCNDKYFPEPKRNLVTLNDTNDLSKKIEELTKQVKKQSDYLDGLDINSIKDQMKSMENSVYKKFEDLEEDVPSKIQEKLEKSPTWADMMKKSITNEQPAVTIETVKKAVTEVHEKDKEMHMRDRGIVIYRVPEDYNLSQDNRKKQDGEFIRSLLHHLECDELAPTVTHLERLGRFDEAKCKEEKYRPIKVRFQLKDMRDRVLNNLRLLKYAPPNIKRVSIRHDLNEIQRAEWYTKIKEAREMSEGSTTTYYRVRGQPGNYSIVGVAKNNAPPQREQGAQQQQQDSGTTEQEPI